MRHFAQAFILVVGLGAALLAAKAERSSSLTVGNCYEVAAASAPTICQ